MRLNAERLNEDAHPTRSLNAFQEACRKDMYPHRKENRYTSNMTFCPQYLYNFYIFVIFLLMIPSVESQSAASVIVENLTSGTGTDPSMTLKLNILLSKIYFPVVRIDIVDT